MRPPGIYHGVPHSEYIADPALSRSRLAKLLTGTPLDYKYQADDDESPEMRLGTAAHLAILEPDRFAELVRPRPSGDGRLKAVKEAREAFAAANPGCIAVDADDYAAAEKAARLVRERTGPAAALRRGDAEVSMWFDQGGLLCKSRPDFIDLDRGIVCDVKTTSRGLGNADVVRILEDHHAAMQCASFNCATYALTGKTVTPYILVVRLVEPVDVRLVLVEPEWLEYGEAQWLAALRIYRECAEADRWDGWADRGVTTVPMPDWLKKRGEKLALANTTGSAA